MSPRKKLGKRSRSGSRKTKSKPRSRSRSPRKTKTKTKSKPRSRSRSRSPRKTKTKTKSKPRSRSRSPRKTKTSKVRIPISRKVVLGTGYGSLSADKRKSVIRSVLKRRGKTPLELYHHINALSIVQKNRNPQFAAKMNADKRWIKQNYL